MTFENLSKEEIERVVELQLERVKKMLGQQGVEPEASKAAVEFLAEKGYNPEFGARPVKRAIQAYLLNDLSKSLLAGALDKDKPITVDVADGALTFGNS